MVSNFGFKPWFQTLVLTKDKVTQYLSAALKIVLCCLLPALCRKFLDKLFSPVAF